jgi:hypothetical protein
MPLPRERTGDEILQELREQHRIVPYSATVTAIGGVLGTLVGLLVVAPQVAEYYAAFYNNERTSVVTLSLIHETTYQVARFLFQCAICTLLGALLAGGLQTIRAFRVTRLSAAFYNHRGDEGMLSLLLYLAGLLATGIGATVISLLLYALFLGLFQRDFTQLLPRELLRDAHLLALVSMLLTFLGILSWLAARAVCIARYRNFRGQQEL